MLYPSLPRGIHQPWSQDEGPQLRIRATAHVLTVSKYEEHTAQDILRSRVSIGPKTHLWWRLRSTSDPHAFSMSTTARTREPFDSWHCQLSTHLSGGVAHTLPTAGTGVDCQVSGL